MNREEIIDLIMVNLYLLRAMRPSTAGGGLAMDFLMDRNWDAVEKLDPERCLKELEVWAKSKRLEGE